MGQKLNLLIAGVGGQGTVFAGRLTSAVALAGGLAVKTAETHGMAQRGGSVVTHVRFGPRVYAPLIPRGEADYLLAFEPLEALRRLPHLTPTGTVIVNTRVLEPLPVLLGEQEYPSGIMETLRRTAGRVIPVDGTSRIAVQRHPQVLNVLLLGLLARLLPFPREHWEQALTDLLPPKLHRANLEAFATGYDEPPLPD